MVQISDISEMYSLSTSARSAGQRIVLVPTMGFLHQGHISLLNEGRRRGDVLVLSIFVNPSQFGPGEDFARYPRDLDRDSHLAREAGVDILFTPCAEQIYPDGHQTVVDVTELSRPLCGVRRVGHFQGVTTVVCKLFNIVMPHEAIFGKKDYQQLAVIRRMVADLNIPVQIIGMPTLREADGLAMSSRNVYLNTEDRQRALCLSRAIATARDLYRSGERAADRLTAAAACILRTEPDIQLEYLELRDGTSLEMLTTASDDSVLAMAVRLGNTRLIDNGLLGEDT